MCVSIGDRWMHKVRGQRNFPFLLNREIHRKMPKLSINIDRQTLYFPLSHYSQFHIWHIVLVWLCRHRPCMQIEKKNCLGSSRSTLRVYRSTPAFEGNRGPCWFLSQFPTPFSFLNYFTSCKFLNSLWQSYKGIRMVREATGLNHHLPDDDTGIVYT
jgi:hypothetical protein